jgi:hypothetical protein
VINFHFLEVADDAALLEEEDEEELDELLESDEDVDEVDATEALFCGLFCWSIPFLSSLFLLWGGEIVADFLTAWESGDRV